MLSQPNRNHVLAILLLGVIIGLVLGSVITLLAEAAPLDGNRGGCNKESQAIDLVCTVQDAGAGWVSGTCLYGEYFLAQTDRTFASGDNVSVSGCVNEHGVITSAPGAPLRVKRR